MLVPIYLAVALLIRAVRIALGFAEPLAMLLPDWVPAERLWSIVLVLVVCCAVGVAVRTRVGRRVRHRVDTTLFERIPGYALFRGLTHQLLGHRRQSAWRPALVSLEDGLAPAFVIEEFDDGRYTVFVPSVPTPFAGNVYVLSRDRVYPIDVPFVQAIQAVSQWGAGSKALVAAMDRQKARPRLP